MRTRPHPHRPAVLVAGALPLLAALLATGCDTPSTAAADAAFSTVRFTLGPRGDIQVYGVSREAVSEAGSYAVPHGRAYPFDRPADKLLVVLRHWPQPERASRASAPRMVIPEDEPATETGFLVDTADWTSAELDGQPLQWLRRDTLRVDATNTDADDLTRLTLSGPHGGRPGQPTPPPDNRACEGLDPSLNRHVVLPEVEPGAAVADVLARLRKQCLDVRYATAAGGVRPGTVQRIVVPIAGRQTGPAVLPPFDGVAVPDRMPGDTVLTDPSRPVTVTVNR
ncbi:hypothetical protein [Streptomyces fulvoviolaceus]|uniref:hypothetical protein n=1 Tax=Streptomyces fulvoviolaceus TaxID=285535 RepID=UPI000694D1B9|nr:hypothetical protein [Streptomyces fulvoviolaceus]MCT9082807.1 hypothetical protein [Streptomyces fulvoviolaceus]